MKIQKRNGKLENISFDKILRRIHNLANDKNLGVIDSVDCDIVSQKVINQIYDGVSSKELDDLAAQISISLCINHPGYSDLASRIAVSNLHKSTMGSFTEAVEELYKHEIINKKFYESAIKNKIRLNSAICQERDYTFDYFGFKTLEKGYLLKYNDIIIERPQYMWMRVALALHVDDIDKCIESYYFLSKKYFTHASPTLYNAGTNRQQMSSCFLLSTEDSIEGIFKSISDCAFISKYAGGIGISVSDIRAKGSYIKGTNGKSDGLIPMLKVYNETCRFINQGGRRNGSFAIYLEPWHPEMLNFLELKKNTGEENMRARDLFYALWICDYFMVCVRDNLDWYFMCPNECPGLTETYGDEFTVLYRSYVDDGKYRISMSARELWNKILVSQIETGTPYISYKDSANKKSNQKHIGTIKSSNLCNEIMLYNTPESTAVCNIATIGLGMFVENGTFNFEKLGIITRVAVINLNKVIDLNFYPTPEAKHNNTTHRPIALGCQGLSNCFVKLRLPFESHEAKILNKQIFECIQYNATVASLKLAKKDGWYSTFPGSPLSEGLFQHNLWGIDEEKLNYDWEALRKEVKIYGIRNSLLTALPPTASTSQILGNTESFEVPTTNLYMRRVLSGNYPIINRYLVNDLLSIGLWTEETKNLLIMNEGSIQKINRIPQEIKNLYKTTWEVSQKVTIDLSAERSPWIDHSQSLNIFMEAPTIAKLSSMHFYGWGKGLKTGSYYIRSRPISDAEKFSVQTDKQEQKNREVLACSIENKGDCEMCSG